MRRIAGAAPSYKPQTRRLRFLLPLSLALTLAACATYGGYDYSSPYYPYDTNYYPYDYSYPYYYSPYYYYPQGYYYRPYVVPKRRYDGHRGGSDHIGGEKRGDGYGSGREGERGGRGGGGRGRGVVAAAAGGIDRNLSRDCPAPLTLKDLINRVV